MRVAGRAHGVAPQAARNLGCWQGSSDASAGAAWLSAPLRLEACASKGRARAQTYSPLRLMCGIGEEMHGTKAWLGMVPRRPPALSALCGGAPARDTQKHQDRAQLQACAAGLSLADGVGHVAAHGTLTPELIHGRAARGCISGMQRQRANQVAFAAHTQTRRHPGGDAASLQGSAGGAGRREQHFGLTGADQERLSCGVRALAGSDEIFAGLKYALLCPHTGPLMNVLRAWRERGGKGKGRVWACTICAR